MNPATKISPYSAARMPAVRLSSPMLGAMVFSLTGSGLTRARKAPALSVRTISLTSSELKLPVIRPLV